MAPVAASRSAEIAPAGQTRGSERGDAVEAALASALAAATSEGRWDVVAQLAKELEARRLARTSNVVAIGERRARK